MDLDDLGDINWPAFGAVYLICAAIVLWSAFTPLYKGIILIMFAPILFFIMRAK